MIQLFKNKKELQKLQTFVKEWQTPLWQYWDEFVDCYLQEGKSEVTVKSVRATLKLLIEHCALYSIEECNTPKVLYEALHEAKNERNWSNVTLNSYRKNLNTYFRWLEDMEYIEVNKISKVRKCKEEINEQLTLNSEQIELVRLKLRDRRDQRLTRWRSVLFIDLMILTGARPCELLNVQCRDIRPMSDGSYQLVIHGKKQKGRMRYYRLASAARDTYEMYLSVRQAVGREEPNLFVSQSKRTGWTDKGMRKLFSRLSREVGFKVTAYSIRRYVATKLRAEGVDLHDIKNHLGHTRVTTTQRYIERSCALTDVGTEVMGKLL